MSRIVNDPKRADALLTAAKAYLSDLGACLSSGWSRGRESDSLRSHEQGISPLEDR
jgi:hypothetical protein